MNSIEEQAKKWVDGIESQNSMTLEEIYEKALLTLEEKKELDKFRGIIESKLRMYSTQWLADSPEIRKYNHIKRIAGILIKCSKGNFVGNIELFLRTLFSDAMDISYKLKGNGFSIGPKSNQFYDIYFELDLIEFFLERGYYIDLNKTLLPNGKNAEFWVEKDSINTYVEAKNINSDKLYHIIYSEEFRKTIAMGTFSFNENQERAIRESFKHQYNRAKSKFKGVNENYSMFFNLSFNLGSLGTKIQDYINKTLNSQTSSNLIYYGIFTPSKIYLYNNKIKALETTKREQNFI